MAKRILVVDDQRMYADNLAIVLRCNGYEVECAYSGGEAIAAMEAQTPDMVILDVQMDGFDGFQVLEATKQRLINTRIIMLTGRAKTIKDAVKAIRGGACDYVTKPVGRDFIGRIGRSIAMDDAINTVVSRTPESVVLSLFNNTESLEANVGQLRTENKRLTDEIDRIRRLDRLWKCAAAALFVLISAIGTLVLSWLANINSEGWLTAIFIGQLVTFYLPWSQGILFKFKNWFSDITLETKRGKPDINSEIGPPI